VNQGYDYKFLVGITYPGGNFIVTTFFFLGIAFQYAAEQQAISDDEWAKDGKENVNIWTVIDMSQKEENEDIEYERGMRP